jgi:hypothetical protein
MLELTTTELAPDELLLDPNNYRFYDLPSFKRVAQRARFGEEGVQAKALTQLQANATFDLQSLKESITTNGFVPLDQIVVEEYSTTPPRYLVIEGNRRVAAVKTLLADQKGGSADLNAEVLKTLEKLPTIIVKGDDKERAAFHKTLMAIRHVSGIREWGPYQQARLVVEMYEAGGQQFGQVAQRIGISPREVARRYRASKALQQMENDDEMGESASPRLYSFFHEAVSQPKVRDWLGFSDKSFAAENEDARKVFYELLSPRTVDGQKAQPKLQNANQQVRQLKDIVDKPEPLKVLADPERSFEDAVRAAQAETLDAGAAHIEGSLTAALNALRKPGIDAWMEPTDKARELWSELSKVIATIEKVMGKA